MSHDYHYQLSVVTISYNAKDYIEATFNSIRQQKQKSFEYIVIDGGSNDGTLDIIKANQDIIDIWCSEPDNGIADALNKGVAKSSGKYIVFLHADDYFVDELSTERALNSLDKNKEIVAFDIIFEKNTQRSRGKARGFNFYTNFKMPFYHPGVICKRSLFEKIGGFDQCFEIAMDYDFLLRAYRQNASFCIESQVLTVFRCTGISSREDWTSLCLRFGEEQKSHDKNCPNNRLNFIYRLWWFFYPIYRKLRFLLS